MSIAIIVLVIIVLVLVLWMYINPTLTKRDKYDEEKKEFHREVQKSHFESQQNIMQQISTLQLSLAEKLNEVQGGIDKRQLESLKTLQESLQSTLTQARDELNRRVDALTQNTDQRLKEISGQVEKRLTQGFEKTTEAFTNVIKRLALIDEAQKRITELSSNVIGLQEILADKRSRGAFGEVQLANLVRNVMPEDHVSLQHSLSNGKRVDCFLYLPEPTGNIAIDAKFPLESYQSMTNQNLEVSARDAAEKQFKRDIQKHIHDIADKYIISGETADGAMMFIPAEAVFAEIHAHHPELVAEAQKAKVWMVSPTTMMAVLTTARAVLKDEATRQQVHIIKDHLGMLAKDFSRFQKRMDDVARHIAKAHEDVEKVHTSARKISARFDKIESVELSQEKLDAIMQDNEEQPNQEK